MAKEWIKLHCKKWLYGSTRDELEPDERSVWIDLLVLAGEFSTQNNNKGQVIATEQALCRQFNIPPELLRRSLAKFVENDKIVIGDDCLEIVSWEKYQPTRWDEWAERNPDTASKDRHKPQTTTNNHKRSQVERERERENKKETKIYTVVFEKWNQSKIIVHRKLTDKMKRSVDSCLKDCTQEEMVSAIEVYAEIVNGKQYYWNHKWTLDEFLTRGMGKFSNAEVAKQNYRQKEGYGKSETRLGKVPGPDERESVEDYIKRKRGEYDDD